MEASPVFIDTNILLRFLLADIPEQSARVAAMLRSAAEGSLAIWSHETVLMEAVFVLERRKSIPREQIVNWLRSLVAGARLSIEGEGVFDDALDLYLKFSNLSIADCYFSILTLRSTSKVVVSFDRGYDRVRGLKRIEPPEIEDI